MDKIKVLWMNNGDESYKTFVANSSLKNLAISFCDNVTESRRKIKEEKWDLIILDAEPKRLKGEIPQVNNLFDVYINLRSENNLIPIFVATANTSIDDWYKRIAKDRFYELPTSSEQLYEDIKAEVENNADYRLRKKYKIIYDFYMSINDSDVSLMNLLRGLEKDQLSQDPLVPGNVRLILDGIMIYLNNENILPIKFMGANLTTCSKWLGDENGDAKDIVPRHVQRFFHSCVAISNNGDHQIPKESSKEREQRTSNPLYVHRQICECKAPYLNKALVYDLLNILHWCATINNEKYEIR